MMRKSVEFITVLIVSGVIPLLRPPKDTGGYPHATTLILSIVIFITLIIVGYRFGVEIDPVEEVKGNCRKDVIVNNVLEIIEIFLGIPTIIVPIYKFAYNSLLIGHGLKVLRSSRLLRNVFGNLYVIILIESVILLFASFISIDYAIAYLLFDYLPDMGTIIPLIMAYLLVIIITGHYECKIVEENIRKLTAQ